jgi:oxygen-independent coproporphyrinogen-3 oxidase
MATIQFDRELVRRYDRHGPRYTSYPTAVQFHSGFDRAAYAKAVRARNGSTEPLSLYVHIPFCASPCFYCGCNKVITRSADRAQAYLTRLYREIELQSALSGRQRRVEQLHFGGGTPTFLAPSDIDALMAHIGRHFTLAEPAAREFSIEIDPRTVDAAFVDSLRTAGFDRMSLGVQDFDPEVQRTINRIQSVEQTLAVIESARAVGFSSVSVDLIYGLPKQTLPGFMRTLDTVIGARADRLAVYAYAHMPQIFKPQRRLKAEDLPSSEARLELLARTVEKLTGAGYEYVGMDHFALPQDSLVRAKHDGTLHRNFQGYSTRADCDLIGLGVSSIGKVGATYAQNFKTLPEYYAAIDAGRLPIQRGIALSSDDVVRRAVIQELMCHERLDFAKIGQELGIDFHRYFEDELTRLSSLASDGLIEMGAERLTVTARGRFLLRNVAMVFDRYLPEETAPVYSKAI